MQKYQMERFTIVILLRLSYQAKYNDSGCYDNILLINIDPLIK